MDTKHEKTMTMYSNKTVVRVIFIFSIFTAGKYRQVFIRELDFYRALSKDYILKSFGVCQQWPRAIFYITCTSFINYFLPCRRQTKFRVHSFYSRKLNRIRNHTVYYCSRFRGKSAGSIRPLDTGLYSFKAISFM